jgi:hypothetical protein
MTPMERVGFMRFGEFKIMLTGARRNVHVEHVWPSTALSSTRSD